jgi:hypothetical protein
VSEAKEGAESLFALHTKWKHTNDKANHSIHKNQGSTAGITQPHLGHVQLVVLALRHAFPELSTEGCVLHRLVGEMLELVKDDLAVHHHKTLYHVRLQRGARVHGMVWIARRAFA